MATKKKPLLNYSRFFLSRIIFRTIYWLIFLGTFVFVGKNYLQTDVLGKIYHAIFGKEKSFKEYFIATSEADKSKMLNYAFWFILLIITLTLISLFINFYLWMRDKYIENNNFFLHKSPVFITNTLIKIVSAFLLTLSFISFTTIIFSLTFITFNTWISRFQKKNTPHLEEFFSWKNEYICKLVLYSAIFVLVAPFTIGRLRDFIEKTKVESPEGLAKSFKSLFNAFPPAKIVLEMLSGSNVGLFHWLILIWFGRKIVSDRVNEFNSFWKKVNDMEKKVINFKHYYYYQESWAITNNSSINLGDYGYLENIPNFLSKSYLESNLSVDSFAQENKQVVEYIEFCEKKIKKTDKKNFLNYCLFNEFNSWNDCVRTKQLIKTLRK